MRPFAIVLAALAVSTPLQAQECVELAKAIAVETAKFSDRSQVSAQQKADLCISEYDSSSSERKGTIELSYKVASGKGEYSQADVAVWQKTECGSNFGSYWSDQAKSSEVKAISAVGASVISDCLNQQKFRIVNISSTGNAISATFANYSVSDLKLIAAEVAPAEVATCTGNGEQIANVKGADVERNHTFQVVCTRIGVSDPKDGRIKYNGGLVSVATPIGAASIPLVEYYDPDLDRATAASLGTQVQSLEKQLAEARKTLGEVATKTDGLAKKLSETLITTTSAPAKASLANYQWTKPRMFSFCEKDEVVVGVEIEGESNNSPYVAPTSLYVRCSKLGSTLR